MHSLKTMRSKFKITNVEFSAFISCTLKRPSLLYISAPLGTLALNSGAALCERKGGSEESRSERRKESRAMSSDHSTEAGCDANRQDGDGAFHSSRRAALER